MIAALVAALTLHVTGVPVRSSSSHCAFVIAAKVVSGGRQTTCLTSVDGFPGPNAVVRSRGTMTFALPRGTWTYRVTVVQRFGADGVHARQTVTGNGARGRLTGGGTVVDRRGGLGRVDLVYRLA